ncbi:MAG: glutamate racemase [Candidatus Komeilibacteria bacterium]
MIGVFDSGIGGLTIFRDIIQRLPEYDYLYLGDSARAPYGNHSQEVIYNYTKQAVDYFLQQGCGLIILACNTASAEALRSLQQDYPEKKILGVLIPLSEAAVETKAKCIGVLATRSTVNSGSFPREIKKLNKQVEVIQQEAPLLVPLIEENQEHKPYTRKIIKQYLLPLRSHGVQTLILGCTHYGFIRDIIQDYVGRKMTILDSGKIVADKTADYLARHPEVEKLLTKKGQQEFLTTDDSRRFDALAVKYLGKKIKSRQIDLL